MKSLKYFFYFLCTALSISANATIIDTTTTFTGAWSPFGEPNTATYGQTFAVTGDNILNSFSLYLTGDVQSSVDFKSYLYEWNGSRAAGAALFVSADQHFMGSIYNTPQEFSFTTGGIALGVGKTYVAFLSTSELFDRVNSTALMPYSGVFGTDALKQGNFVYYNNGNNFSLLTTSNWEKSSGQDDVWFKASLSSTQVPEPTSLALLGIGIVGLGFSRRQRKITQ